VRCIVTLGSWGGSCGQHPPLNVESSDVVVTGCCCCVFSAELLKVANMACLEFELD